MTEDKFNKIIDRIVRSIAASIPIAATFSTFWSETEMDIELEELRTFYETLSGELSKLSSSKNIGEIDMRELYSIIKVTSEKIYYEKRESRLKAYAKLLTGALENGLTIEQAKWHHFIYLIDHFQNEHFRILKSINENEGIRFEKLLLQTGFSSNKLDWGLPIAILNDLKNAGLISITHIGDPRGSEWLSNGGDWSNQWRSTQYSTLTLGKEFGKFVTDST